MKVPYGLLVFAAVGLGVCATTGQAQAQATRTWVSGVGDDVNPCSRTAPCKTWAGAISKTAANGEIDALDPGGFGYVTITKAITIDGGGGQVASALASGVTGFTVSAGSTDIVILRNLRVNGAGGVGSNGVDGIKFNSGAALIVENTVIQTFTDDCINFAPSAAATLIIRNSVLENCSNAALAASTTATGALQNHVTAYNSSFQASNNGPGVSIGTNTYCQIFGGDIAANVRYGALASGLGAFLDLDGVDVSNNFTGGIHATNNGTISVGNSVITYNMGTGIVADSAGVAATWGNNRVQYNRTGSTETDGAFTTTITPK